MKAHNSCSGAVSSRPGVEDTERGRQAWNACVFQRRQINSSGLQTGTRLLKAEPQGGEKKAFLGGVIRKTNKENAKELF